MRVYISGQKWLGLEVFRICRRMNFDIAGVCVPNTDKYLLPAARTFGVPITPAGSFSADAMPHGVDLGITAHSWDYIGKRARYKAAIGWLGYHPSLLPRHRGRSAVEWTLRMKDPVAGGSIYWLNSGVDRGDVAKQDWCFVPPKLHGMHPSLGARILWREHLLPMGVRLMEEVLSDVSRGVITRIPQNNEFSTFEPSLDIKDIYKPDALMLTQSRNE